MDYEKEYKMALERCRWQLANGRISEESATDLFRDLYDSEDEEIRKDIIEHFLYEIEELSNKGEEYEAEIEELSKYVDYLEKQKERRAYWELYKGVSESEWFKENYKGKSLGEEDEQRSAEINVKALLAADRLASAEMTGRLKERSDILENPEKYGLQKPAEWSLSQLKMFDDILVAIELDKAFTDERVEELVNLLNTCRLRKYSTKPAEWSEEDEDKLYRIIETLLADKEVARQEYPHCDVLCKAYDELISWLKSLRPQPKQEWSEEDEKRRKNVLRLITEVNDRYIKEESRSPFCAEILWLKSLPPHSTHHSVE